MLHVSHVMLLYVNQVVKVAISESCRKMELVHIVFSHNCPKLKFEAVVIHIVCLPFYF